MGHLIDPSIQHGPNCISCLTPYPKPVKRYLLSRVQLFETPWTVANQAPLSVRFSRQEYWSGLPFPSLGDLPNPGIKPESPALQVGSLPSEPPGSPAALMIRPVCS